MEKTPEPSMEKGEEKKVNPSEWQDKLDKSFENLLEQDNFDLQDFVDIAFKHGILDRIIPEDQKVKEKRKEQDRRFWEGSRDDKELYERIAYATQREKEAVKQGHTLGKGWIAGPSRFFARTLRKEDVFEKLTSSEDEDWKDLMERLYSKLQQKAIEQAEKRGRDEEMVIYPQDTEGFVYLPENEEKIEGTLERYTDDGSGWFKAKSPKGHQKLYELTEGDGLSPEQIREYFKPKS